MNALAKKEYRRQLFKELIDIVEELGWEVALPNNDENDDEVPGLIIGTAEYINFILSSIDDQDMDFT